jgi:hypothetical protein
VLSWACLSDRRQPGRQAATIGLCLHVGYGHIWKLATENAGKIILRGS